MEAVDLKKLQKIRIGHDGSSSGAGWYLDKVIVKNKNKRGTEQVFECNRLVGVIVILTMIICRNNLQCCVRTYMCFKG